MRPALIDSVEQKSWPTTRLIYSGSEMQCLGVIVLTRVHIQLWGVHSLFERSAYRFKLGGTFHDKPLASADMSSSRASSSS